MDETARRWAERFVTRRDRTGSYLPYELQVLGRRLASYRLKSERDAQYYALIADAASLFVGLIKDGVVRRM